MMIWDETTQNHFDILRQKALIDGLSSDEADELALLRQEAEMFANNYLAQAIQTLQQEQETLKIELQQNEQKNEALRMVQAQQETLLNESRQWLANLEI